MAKATFLQTSFLGGEWSLAAQGRMDREDYRTALNLSLNGIPVETGAWQRRAGTFLTAPTRTGQEAYIKEIHFQQQNSYVAEFTDQHLRFMTDNHLVLTGEPLEMEDGVVGISAATPCKINTTTNHLLVSGDEVEFYFTGDTGGQTDIIGLNELTGRQFVVTVIDADEFTIEDSVTGDPFDGSAVTPPPTGTSLRVQKVYDVAGATGFTPTANATLNIIQNEDVAFILGASFPPQSVTIDESTSPATIAVASAFMRDGPYMDEFSVAKASNIKLEPSGLTGNIDLEAQDYAGTPIPFFVATDVGRMVRLLEEAGPWDVATPYAIGDNVVYKGGVYISLTAANTGNIPPASLTDWAVNPDPFHWTWGIITAFTDPTTVEFDILGEDLFNTFPKSTFRMGLYSNTTGWPTCGTFHQGRFWLAGAQPNRIDAAKPSADSSIILDFAPTNPSGVVADDNGIEATLKSTDVNPIYWVVSVDRGLQLGTKGGEWLIQASTLNNPITPTDRVVNRITKFRCADTQPVIAPLSTVFVQGNNKNLIELVPDGTQGGKYAGMNMSLYAKHLTGRDGGLVRIAYQQETTPLVWAVNEVGNLFSCTYKRVSPWASNEPVFMGWAQHQFNNQADNSGRRVLDICGGPSPDGTTDTINLVTYNPGGEPVVYWNENMAKLFEEGDGIFDSFHMDHMKIPQVFSFTFTDPGDWSTPIISMEIHGLWDLENQEVTAYVAGFNLGTYFVSLGSISIAVNPFDPLNPDVPQFTSEYLKDNFQVDAATFDLDDLQFGYSYFNTRRSGDDFWEAYAIPAVVGQTFLSKAQIVRPVTSQESGAANGPAFGKSRRIHKAVYLLNPSQNMFWGTSFNELSPMQFEFPGGTRYNQLQLFSGTHKDTMNDNNNIDASQLCWQSDGTMPATVLAVGWFIQTQDE